MKCTICGKEVIWFDALRTALTHGPGTKNKHRDHFPVVEGVTNEEGVLL